MPCTVPYSYSPSATAAAHRETTISIAKAQLRIFFIRFSSQFLFPNPFGRISAKRAVRMRLVGFAFTILSGRASHGFAADCYQYSIEYTLRCFVIIIRLVGRFVNRVNIIFFSRLSKMQSGNIRVRKRRNIHFLSHWAGCEFCKDTGMARRVRRGEKICIFARTGAVLGAILWQNGVFRAR